MTITRRGAVWRGTDAADLDAYLAEFQAGGYPVSVTVHPGCGSCGKTTGFFVLLDDDEGAAVRVCADCEDEVEMLDSADQLASCELGEATCPCGADQFDVAVGYSLLDDGEVRWVSIGLRCRADGRLGVYTDWKIDYVPSRHLLDAA
jgi:hypothetical protein